MSPILSRQIIKNRMSDILCAKATPFWLNESKTRPVNVLKTVT
ncbi:hypothetical protein FB99_12870 [Pantoea agglomerans]|nr:hypothetical protein FB99_12870 [Pantoea agglomerans]